MILRFDGAVGGAVVPDAWLTPTNTPPILSTADREVDPVFAAIV